MGKRLLTRAAAALGIAMTLAAGLGSAASASSTAVEPNPVEAQVAPNRCGAGYGFQEMHRLNSFGPTFGEIYLYYNSSNGNNCVFTEKLISRGTPTFVSARLCRQSDGRCVSDADDYLYYAGPVYLYAPNTCVRWGGSVEAADGREDSWMSGWEHCG